MVTSDRSYPSDKQLVGIAFSIVTTALGGFVLIISSPINSTDQSQSLLRSSKTSNFDLDQQDGVMISDVARASIFIADIIDNLSKSTEVSPVVGGYSGVTVCSTFTSSAVRVDHTCVHVTHRAPALPQSSHSLPRFP